MLQNQKPYNPGYKAIALFPGQDHLWPYNEYKAMALLQPSRSLKFAITDLDL